MKYHVSFDLDFKRHKYPGKFIVFEGNEGSGKSKQVDKVAEILKKNGKKVIKTGEPTNGVVGKFIREKALAGKVKITSMTMQYLYTADRIEHVREIETYLKKGYIVLCDRYFWTTIAFGIGDLSNELKEKEDFYLSAFSRFLLPDATFYLDVDIKTAMSRIGASHKHKEIYDNKKSWLKIQKGYDFLIKKLPSIITRIDGTGTVDEVNGEILKKLKKIL